MHRTLSFIMTVFQHFKFQTYKSHSVIVLKYKVRLWLLYELHPIIITFVTSVCKHIDSNKLLINCPLLLVDKQDNQHLVKKFNIYWTEDQSLTLILTTATVLAQ